MQHIEFENTLMYMLLKGNHPVLEVLQNQYLNSKVVSREFTGVGFFTEFVVNPDITQVKPSGFYIDDVYASFKGEKGAVLSFYLSIKNGFIWYLEGITISDCLGSWPENYTDFSLLYINNKRNIDKMINKYNR